MLQNTTTSIILKPLIDTLQSYGVDYAQLFEEAGIELSLADNNTRIPVTKMYNLWEHAALASNNDAIGLDVAIRAMENMLLPIFIAVQTSDSIPEALERVKRFTSDVSNGVTVDYLITDAIKIFIDESQSTGRKKTSIYGIDMFCAATVVQSKRIVGNQHPPLKLELRRPKPKNQHAFNDFFDCPISYNSTRNCISFAIDDISKSLPNSNREIASHLDGVIQRNIEGLETNEFMHSVHRFVHTELSSHVPSHIPKLNEVAEHFKMSDRSLQRRLNEHDTSLKVVIDEARSELSTHYLQRSDYSIGEIGFMLGFSTESNFIRAFKRWTGKTPSQLRKQRQIV